MKKCSKCGQVKNFSHYYKLGISKDGHRPDCKECHRVMKKDKKGTVDYECRRMAGNITRRLGELKNPKNKCYENIKSEIGHNIPTIAEELKKNFSVEIQNFIDNGITPSVDRIDSSKNYSIENIQITTIEDNVSRGVVNAVLETSVKIRAHFDNGDTITYPSISEASRSLGIKRDTIYYHLDKNSKTNKGISFVRVCPIF